AGAGARRIAQRRSRTAARGGVRAGGAHGRDAHALGADRGGTAGAGAAAPGRPRQHAGAGGRRLPRGERYRQRGDRARGARAPGGPHHSRQSRTPRTVDPGESDGRHGAARRALRRAGDAAGAQLTVPPADHSIRVDVETSYLDEQSDPREHRFVFAYTITIRNEGQVPARLLTRHWVITDANGKVEEVRGDGVVGEQPYMQPGQGFRYSSGAVIETPVGTMQGSYQMVADDGQHFDAPIAPFRLAMPGVLH